MTAGTTVTTRVLHIINEMGVGGAEALVQALVEGGASVGWRSAVVSSGGWRADALAAADQETHLVRRIRRDPRSVALAMIDTRSAIRNARPDVVVAHNILATVVARGALVLAGQKRPVVSVFHGVPDRDYERAASILDRASSAVVVVTDAIGRRLVDAGLRPEKLTVIPNAVEPPTLVDREDACAQTGLDPAALHVLCAARLVPQKRHDVLLEAWAHARPPATLLLAGDGPSRIELEARAADLGLADSVRFLGPRTDVPTLLCASEVAVLASDWEGLPLSALEAMAAGVPVVATDVDGLSELLGDGAGVLVPPRSPVSLGEELVALLAAPQRRRDLADRGRRLVESRHHPSQMFGDYAALFSGLMKDRTK